jgi:hypothetical protein
MDQFSRVFETPYDNTDINAFNCNVDRIGHGLDPKDLMYVMNHFLYGTIELGTLKLQIPLKEQAHNSNSEKSLFEHVDNCTSVFNKKPNFIEVDFYTIGDALSVVSNINNVTPPLYKKLSAASDNSTSSPVRHSSLSPTEYVMIDNSSVGSSGCRSKNDVISLLFSVLSVAVVSLFY